MAKYRERLVRSSLYGESVYWAVSEFLENNIYRDEHGDRIYTCDITVSPAGSIDYVYSCEVSQECNDSTGYNIVSHVDNVVYHTIFSAEQIKKFIKDKTILYGKAN